MKKSKTGQPSPNKEVLPGPTTQPPHDIDPPVMVPCYKCGEPAVQIVAGWIRNSEDEKRDSRWRRPTARDFRIACWPCRQKAGEVDTSFELQNIIVIPPGGYATPEQYDGIDLRLPEDFVNLESVIYVDNYCRCRKGDK